MKCPCCGKFMLKDIDPVSHIPVWLCEGCRWQEGRMRMSLLEFLSLSDPFMKPWPRNWPKKLASHEGMVQVRPGQRLEVTFELEYADRH